jgi:propanediol utilization protein
MPTNSATVRSTFPIRKVTRRFYAGRSVRAAVVSRPVRTTFILQGTPGVERISFRVGRAIALSRGF